jgi:hypothetical protein
MKPSRCYQVLALVGSLPLCIAAHAVTGGACSSSSSGSVTLNGAGTSSYNASGSAGNGTCSTDVGTALSGSPNGLPSYIAVSTSLASQVAISGSTLKLSSSGELILQVELGHTFLLPASASSSNAAALHQSFVLSPGEEVNYEFNLLQQGNTSSAGGCAYGVCFNPDVNITLSSGSGTPATFASGPDSLGNGSAPPEQESEFIGQLVNSTDALVTYTLTAIMSYPTTGISTGSGEDYGNAPDDYVSFQDELDLTPTAVAAPEIDPSSAASGLALLAGVLLVLRGRKRSLSA